MDSDILSRLITKSGPLVLIPYPAVTVDKGQHLERLKQPRDIEQLWIDYVTGLAREAEAHPDREATSLRLASTPLWSELPMVQRHCAVFSKILRIKSLSG